MWPNPQFPVDLVTFTEETLNAKLHFLWSACFWIGLSAAAKIYCAYALFQNAETCLKEVQKFGIIRGFSLPNPKYYIL